MDSDAITFGDLKRTTTLPGHALGVLFTMVLGHDQAPADDCPVSVGEAQAAWLLHHLSDAAVGSHYTRLYVVGCAVGHARAAARPGDPLPRLTPIYQIGDRRFLHFVATAGMPAAIDLLTAAPAKATPANYVETVTYDLGEIAARNRQKIAERRAMLARDDDPETP